MKILIFLLIFVVSFGTLFISNSNALVGPSAPQSDPSLPEISLQLEYRDSNGALVGYLEPSIFYLRNLGMIHEMLDAQEDKTIITKDGKNFEKIEFEYFNYNTESPSQMAGYSVGWDGYGVLWARFDGILSGNGDSVLAHWKMLRPI